MKANQKTMRKMLIYVYDDDMTRVREAAAQMDLSVASVVRHLIKAGLNEVGSTRELRIPWTTARSEHPTPKRRVG
jgi:hypothetical protein